METDDYESLPASSTMSTHMIAGAAAGVMEHCIMYPVDCVKTRMQCLVPDPRANYRSVADALYRIVRYEGIKNTMRGLDAMVYGAGPAHAFYFASYEYLKRQLSGNKQGNHMANAAAGMGATVLHDAIMNPAEVIKQRMQVYDSPYRSCMHCVTKVMQAEGVRAFYRSYMTQLCMNIPFQSLHFVVYEYCQDKLNSERAYNPSTHVISGAMAGAVASAVTNPLDVCKTLLNTQEKCAVSSTDSAISGMGQAFRTIYQFRGFSGFFIGLTPRVIHQMPSTAICWSVYEFFKYALTEKSRADCDGYVAPSAITPAVQAACVDEC